MKRTIEEENNEFVKKFFKLINSMGNDTDLAEVFVKELASEHRTLQQNAMRFFKDTIEKYALNSMDFTDARNEAGLKWAKAVRKTGETDHHIPFI